MVKYETELDAVFTALAHPARRAMLARLGRGEATVGQLAEPLDMSLPAVTKHLKVLERAHLIHRGRNAQWRPCRIKAAPLKEAIPAIVVYVAVFWLLGLLLPSLLLVWPLAIVNVLTGVVGALYAWGFNSAGKRVPMVLKEKDAEAPPLRKLLVKEKD